MRDPDALAAAMERTVDQPLDPNTLRVRAMDFHVEHIAGQYLEALGLPLAPCA
jgi:hypothetical protein